MVMGRIEQARHREGVHHPRRREDVLMAVAPGRIAVLIPRIVIARGAAPHPDGPRADPRLRFTDLHRIRSEERQYLRIGLWICHGHTASVTTSPSCCLCFGTDRVLPRPEFNIPSS